MAEKEKWASKREASKSVLQPDRGFVAVVGVVKLGHPVVWYGLEKVVRKMHQGSAH